MQQPRRPVVLGDEQVRRAIAIEVADRQTAPDDLSLHPRARRRGDVSKLTALIVEEEHALGERRAIASEGDVLVRVAVDQADILLPIPIVVHERRPEGRERKARLTQPHIGRHVHELAAASVAEQRRPLAGEIADQHVLPPGTGQVRGVNAHSGARPALPSVGDP